MPESKTEKVSEDMTEKDEQRVADGSGRPEVVHLARKGSAAAGATARGSAVAERAAPVGGAVSLTPVFDALVRDWRRKGREVPLRHKQAPSLRGRMAA